MLPHTILTLLHTIVAPLLNLHATTYHDPSPSSLMVPISCSKKVTFLFPISHSEERTLVCLLGLVGFLLLAYSTKLQYLEKLRVSG